MSQILQTYGYNPVLHYKCPGSHTDAQEDRLYDSRHCRLSFSYLTTTPVSDGVSHRYSRHTLCNSVC